MGVCKNVLRFRAKKQIANRAFDSLDLFASKIYNIKSSKNILKIWDIFSLLGCKFYANKSGLNLIMLSKALFAI